MDRINETLHSSHAFINRQFKEFQNNSDAYKNLGIIVSGVALGSISHPHTAMIAGISMFTYNRFTQINSPTFHNSARLFIGIGLGSSIPGAVRSLITPVNIKHGKILGEFDQMFNHELRTTMSAIGLSTGSLLGFHSKYDKAFFSVIGRLYQIISEDTAYSSNFISIVNSLNLFHSLEPDDGNLITYLTFNSLLLNLLYPSDTILDDSLSAGSMSLKLGLFFKLFDHLGSVHNSSPNYITLIIYLLFIDTFIQIFIDPF